MRAVSAPGPPLTITDPPSAHTTASIKAKAHRIVALTPARAAAGTTPTGWLLLRPCHFGRAGSPRAATGGGGSRRRRLPQPRRPRAAMVPHLELSPTGSPDLLHPQARAAAGTTPTGSRPRGSGPLHGSGAGRPPAPAAAIERVQEVSPAPARGER